MSQGLSDMSMTELFRLEAETALAAITDGLLALEQGDTSHLEAMMRAAHSLKGAARIVGFAAAVQASHAMEDCFVAAQRGEVALGRAHIDRLLVGVDLLGRIAKSTEAEVAQWDREKRPEVDAFLASLKNVPEEGTATPAPPPASAHAPEPVTAPAAAPDPVATEQKASDGPKAGDSRVLRVTADNLNRLLGLAGESLVESRWLRPYGAAVLRLKRMHHDLTLSLDQLRDRLAAGTPDERVKEAFVESQRRLALCRDYLAERLVELDTFDRRSTNLAHRLYGEALAVRMRPFADGIAGFPRMVRDVARQLGKEVKLTVQGQDTQVDRDILEKLEAPLGHLLRNSVDHGIESAGERAAAGKPPAGAIRLEARHRAGVLLITVSDDGRGADLEKIRAAVLRRKLVSAGMAPKLSEAELLEFLFLPGFTVKEAVTEISGRGVGLDVVQSMVKGVRGTVRVISTPGQGMRFQLQLPLTLSVVRALLVEIGGEPYAVPLGFIARTVRVPQSGVASTEGRQHFAMDGRRVGLVSAHQLLGREGAPPGDELPVVVIGEGEHRYGVVVDRFVGERELVVQPLDPRLGKIKDIAAGALMEDGAPVLILDVEDLVRSVEKFALAGQLSAVHTAGHAHTAAARKRVLVVDDSLTVRELERKLLESRGYAVEVAVDGMDGWNAVRTGAFALVITDVDMPRLDGIELTKLIKQDAKLRALPVMIVSYKDREEDRRRGLEAGADYYLTKGSFHDETMLHAVADLIGAAQEAPA
ncbi:MAG: hybrid sensor histidine kinase/response regulator [Verrucomicrobia bacterium]|nr:hybrid sensor histidine kinase/response regulator [Verrucomicrobiota bacterium]